MSILNLLSSHHNIQFYWNDTNFNVYQFMSEKNISYSADIVIINIPTVEKPNPDVWLSIWLIYHAYLWKMYYDVYTWVLHMIIGWNLHLSCCFHLFRYLLVCLKYQVSHLYIQSHQCGENCVQVILILTNLYMLNWRWLSKYLSNLCNATIKEQSCNVFDTLCLFTYKKI